VIHFSSAARSVNAIMTATYWLIGRRMVEGEQKGKCRAGYGLALLARLSEDLTSRCGRGFSKRNLDPMRRFYLSRPNPQTLSADSASDGTEVTVEAVDIDETDHNFARCRRGSRRQTIPLLDLPLPNPLPDGAEWIEAYRWWARGSEP